MDKVFQTRFLAQGSLLIAISLVLIEEYSKGNHDLARDPTLVTATVRQNHTKCMDYLQIKKVIIPIDRTVRNHCLEKVEMVQSLHANTFIHLFVPKSQIVKKWRHQNDSFLE